MKFDFNHFDSGSLNVSSSLSFCFMKCVNHRQKPLIRDFLQYFQFCDVHVHMYTTPTGTFLTVRTDAVCRPLLQDHC